MARAQFVFVTSTALVPGGSSGAWYCWRLLGANGRPLARSPRTYADLPACREAAREIPELLVIADLTCVTDAATGLWEWQLRSDQELLAQSARSYQRRRESQYSADAFINAAALAPLSAGLIQLSSRGSAAVVGAARGLRTAASVL